MTPEQKMAFITYIYGLIFTSKQMGTDITQVTIGPQWGPHVVGGEYVKGRLFVNGTVRGFDIALDVGNKLPNGGIAPLMLRMLEQNPLKMTAGGVYSQYAVAAQQGSKIMWVIETSTNKFFGRMQDGQWHKNEMRAVTTNAGTAYASMGTNPPNTGAATPAPDAASPDNLQPIEGDIPEYVLHHHAELPEYE